jgi:anti-anti-sigma factor
MEITKDESGGRHRLKLAGRLDIQGSEELRDALRDLAKGGLNSIVDVSEVEACDTTALQLLYAARKTVAAGGGRFTLAGLSSGLVESSAAIGVSLKELTGDSENGA